MRRVFCDLCQEEIKHLVTEVAFRLEGGQPTNYQLHGKCSNVFESMMRYPLEGYWKREFDEVTKNLKLKKVEEKLDGNP